MFGLWGKKKPEKLVDELDEVYLTREVADAALVRAAREATLPVVIASFFPASLERIGRRFASAATGGGETTRRLAKSPWPSHPLPAGAPWLFDAREATQSSGLDTWLIRGERSFLFLFVEHYPGWARERSMLALFEEASVKHPQHVRFFLGLNEPLMLAFGGEKVAKLMQAMGMAEDEKVAHPMVDKSIVNAQKKIDAKVTSAAPARSDAEWFQLNMR